MKKHILLFSVFTMFLFVFSSIPLISSAQTIGSQIYLTTSPEVPLAGKLVTIYLSYPLTDLTRANISWYVNNVLQSQGLGQTNVSIPVGKVGENTRVRVSIQTKEGSVSSQSLTITPASVDILWETKSYTPPLYKGKALSTQGSTLRFTAVPTFIKNGTLLNPADLYYTWEGKGGSLGSSTKGKYSVEITFDTKLAGKTISVSVTNREKTVFAKQDITLPKTVPDIVFYENNLVSGILYNKSIPDTFSSPKKTFSLIAEPFYIPNSVLLEGQYAWKVNGKIETPDEGAKILTVSQEGATNAGKNNIEFSITNKTLVGGIIKKVLSLTL